MGLCLCVFDGDEELDAVNVGAYSDFKVLRDTVRDRLEHGDAGSRFPTLMFHSDCDGEWSPTEAAVLQSELATVTRELAVMPPSPLPDGWQQAVAQEVSIVPTSLLECFFDVDGEPLLERISALCALSIRTCLPITFQ